MNIARLVTILVAGCLVYPGTNAAEGLGQADREKALASLVESEREFSRTSEAKGIREAFLIFLAPDAVVFRPAPVEGRPVYEKMDPANPAVLTWEPEVAEVSAEGDLGYTSGPYVLRPARDAEPTVFGHYVSVWKKQPDGAWRVFLDIGVQHGRPVSSGAVGQVVTPKVGTESIPLSPERLRDEERAFGPLAGSIVTEAGAKGLRKALAEFATDDIRLYRQGKIPTVGKRHIKELIPMNAGRVGPGNQQRIGNYKVGMAGSGDLAYSFGTSRFRRTRTISENTSFLRIWRKNPSAAWKICLDIELPLPAEGGKKD